MCSRFRADSSADLLTDPAQLACDPGIHPGGVSLGTDKAPGDLQTDQSEAQDGLSIGPIRGTDWVVKWTNQRQVFR